MAKVTLEFIEEALKKYVPHQSIRYCIQWIEEHQINLKITRSRNSKYGDYRPPQRGFGHRISINHDLNPYAFLITFIHEVAHLNQWKRKKQIIIPHGKDWKEEYRKLMIPILRENIFPPDVVAALNNYMTNPSATSCSDHDLLRALRNYDREEDKWITLEELNFGVKFKIRTGRTFIKKEKLRKNYSCIDCRSKSIYFINPITEVMPVDH
ncbi:MAG TPA: sprT domain-containing protein [Bacteroidia bacterium]|nr:sprT domain-containing protein [Bacteroidia bacterium]MBP7713901.1 sprT domain-containing protein [Bacteroidia bacterium]MBP8668082.1 sprT domain-containing protein [Bacteroidia bacterium]HOZ82896.1 sprT domain-containing protein [Bacteroidia bacterium]HOZ89866.1 sprT domain-containing protein [Bacteroidia bacterium]